MLSHKVLMFLSCISFQKAILWWLSELLFWEVQYWFLVDNFQVPVNLYPTYFHLNLNILYIHIQMLFMAFYNSIMLILHLFCRRNTKLNLDFLLGSLAKDVLFSWVNYWYISFTLSENPLFHCIYLNKCIHNNII